MAFLGAKYYQVKMQKLKTKSIRLPLSALNVDLFGEDIENSPLVFESGDTDGYITPTERKPFKLTWLEKDRCFIHVGCLQMMMKVFLAMQGIVWQNLKRLQRKGWSVTAATEMEFYLVNAEHSSLKPPINPKTNTQLVLQMCSPLKI